MPTDLLSVTETDHSKDNPYLQIQREVPVSQALTQFEQMQQSGKGPYDYYEKMFKQIFNDLPQEDLPRGSENSNHIYFLLGRKRTELDPNGIKDFWDIVDIGSLYLDENSIMQNGAEILQKQFDLAEALSLEYKLHFMVKGKYIPFMVERIAKAIEEDSEFGKVVRFFKTTDTMGSNESEAEKAGTGDIVPQMVIYTALGKQSAVTAVEKLQQLFSDVTPEMKKSMSINEVPRLNEKIDEWLYIANGSADVKKSYLKMKQNVAEYEAHPEKYNQGLEDEYKNLENLTPDRIIYLPIKFKLPDGSTYTHLMKIPRSFMEMNIIFFSNHVKPASFDQVNGVWTTVEGPPNALIPDEFFQMDIQSYLADPQTVPDFKDKNKMIKACEYFAHQIWLEPAVRRAKMSNKTFVPSEVKKQSELFANHPNMLTNDGVFYTCNDASSVIDHIKNRENYPSDELSKEIEKARKVIEKSE